VNCIEYNFFGEIDFQDKEKGKKQEQESGEALKQFWFGQIIGENIEDKQKRHKQAYRREVYPNCPGGFFHNVSFPGCY
jgi:hypothetical protein